MSEWAAVLTAFFTGVGSLVTAWLSVTISKRRARKDCDARVDEVRKAIRFGAELKDDDHPPP